MKYSKLGISLLAAFGVAFSPISLLPASAYSDSTVHGSEAAALSDISPETLEQAREEFLNAGYSYDVLNLPEGEFYKFHIDEGISLVLPSEEVHAGGQADSMYAAPQGVKAGRHDGGFWMELSPTMQNRVNTLGAAALGFGACLIPGVGWAGCAAFTAAITVVSIQVAESDCASKNQTLRVEFNWRGDHEGSRCI